MLQFVHELIDVFEIPVHRRETNIGDIVKYIKPLNHVFPYGYGGDFLLAGILKMFFDFIHQAFHGFKADTAFLAGNADPFKNFVSIEILPPAVFFNHDQGSFFDPLVSGEPLFAVETYPPPPGHVAFLVKAGIYDFILHIGAFGTFHGLSVFGSEFQFQRKLFAKLFDLAAGGFMKWFFAEMRQRFNDHIADQFHFRLGHAASG